jgi:hypothetical protein
MSDYIPKPNTGSMFPNGRKKEPQQPDLNRQDPPYQGADARVHGCHPGRGAGGHGCQRLAQR